MNQYIDSKEQLVIEIMVQDIQQSTKFYQLLGFHLLRDGGDFVELTWEDHRLFLAQTSAVHDKQNIQLAPRGNFPLANVRVMVADVDYYWKKVNEMSAEIIVPIGDRYYGLRDFTIADPDGFGIRFASYL